MQKMVEVLTRNDTVTKVDAIGIVHCKWMFTVSTTNPGTKHKVQNILWKEDLMSQLIWPKYTLHFHMTVPSKELKQEYTEHEYNCTRSSVYALE